MISNNDNQELNNLFSNMNLEPLNLELDKEIDGITNILEAIKIIDSNVDNIKEENLNRFINDKYIPLEVNNLLCDTYFDDEDFVYLKLQLPTPILDYIMHFHSGDLIDYFSLILNNKDREVFDNSEIYHNILAVYQYVLNYYQQPETIQPIDKIKNFPLGYFKWVSVIINELRHQLKLTPEEQPDFYEMSKLDQELSYGLNIVISHLYIIIKYYHQCGMNIYQLSEKHIKRFVRLVNNLSVIMIYFKFYSVDIPSDGIIPNFIDP